VGKRRKRLTMDKYAKKYAKVREALFGKEEETSPVVTTEAVSVVKQPKVEEVVEEIKIVSEPRPKKAPAKKKTSTKTKAKSRTKKTTAKKSTRKKK
jgi:hypothetical protein